MHEVLNVGQLSEMPGFEEATRDLIDPVLEEGAKICQDVLSIDQSGDQRMYAPYVGQVTTPKGFIEACKHSARADGLAYLLTLISVVWVCR